MLEKIKKLCKTNGITLTQLEESLGFANKVLYRWDNSNPGIDKVAAVANYFGVSVDYLISEEDEEPMSEKDELLQHLFDDRPEMRMLFSVTENATTEEIMQAVKIIEALKK